MGEIAEMMLEGFMCEQCGEIIGDMETGEGQGFPGLCAGCAANSKPERSQQTTGKKFSCPTCGKRFRLAIAVEQHTRDKHAAAKTTEETG